MHEVSIHRDGPNAILRFDFKEYPRNPPKKWEMQCFNKVQIQLLLFGVSDFSINGIINKSNMKLILSKEGDDVRFSSHSEGFNINILAKFVYIHNISGYQDDKV